MSEKVRSSIALIFPVSGGIELKTHNILFFKQVQRECIFLKERRNRFFIHTVINTFMSCRKFISGKEIHFIQVLHGMQTIQVLQVLKDVQLFDGLLRE
jgi:hypothetical protein